MLNLKALRVNMTNMTANYEDVPQKYKFFGGRSLVVRIVTDEIPPACDPLGPENKLIVATTLFSGTAVTTGNRVSVGGKSPLTGGIKEASSGGMASYMMIRQGIKYIVVEGLPETDDLYVLHIDKNGCASIEISNDFKGLCNFDLVAKIRDKYSKDCAVLCSGLAGERKNIIASVMVTDFYTGYPTRAAARGGLGALMGSKGLKAIVIEKPDTLNERQFADKQKMLAANKDYVKVVMNHPACNMRCKFGTSGGVRNNEQNGILPVKNFRSEPFENVGNIDAAAFANFCVDNGGKPGLACQPGCVVRCSQVLKMDGEFLASGVQYETIGLCGSNCMIDDLETIARISNYCDDYGVDTIEFGAALGVFMECGIVEWGDREGALAMCREMIAGETEHGKLIPTGLRNISEALDQPRVPHTKGQALAAYDPRANITTGSVYQFSAHGGDHTAGGPVPDKEGNWINISKIAMPFNIALDSCLCMFAGIPMMIDPSLRIALQGWMEGAYGGEWPVNKIVDILGADTLTLEFRYNNAAGVGGVEKLPKFFYDEESVITGKKSAPPEDQFAELQKYFVNRELVQKDW